MNLLTVGSEVFLRSHMGPLLIASSVLGMCLGVMMSRTYLGTLLGSVMGNGTGISAGSYLFQLLRGFVLGGMISSALPLGLPFNPRALFKLCLATQVSVPLYEWA